MGNSNQKIVTFLTFQGDAEEAMNLYLSLFDDSEITSIVRYEANGVGKEGTIQHAAFSLNGQTFMCIDSSVNHEWTFTPAVSLYVTCQTEKEIERLFGSLSEDGVVHMPLADYGFSKKFGWVDDKYGVSWQLNLPND